MAKIQVFAGLVLPMPLSLVCRCLPSFGLFSWSFLRIRLMVSLGVSGISSSSKAAS